MQTDLQAIRDYYLDCYRQSIVDARLVFSQIATELLIEIPTLPHSEFIFRLYRLDIIGGPSKEPSIREVNVEPRTIEAPMQSFRAPVDVNSPLVWNGIEFHVTSAAMPYQELLDWTARWIDVSDDRYDESKEFQNVIHGVQPPESFDGGYSLCVDFGSAPTDAMFELLSLVSRNAIRISMDSAAYLTSDGDDRGE